MSQDVQQGNMPSNLISRMEELYEPFWTGQAIEVLVGEGIDKFVSHSQRDADFVEQVVELHREMDGDGGCYNSIDLRTVRMDTTTHELDFDIVYRSGDRLHLSAEFTAKDKQADLYDLKIFAKSSEGNRYVFAERPTQSDLEILSFMYQILERMGYIKETVPTTL